MAAMQKALSFFGIYPDESGHAEMPMNPEPSLKVGNQPSMSLVTNFMARRKKQDGIDVISTLEPKKYEDALSIAEDYKQDVPVIINLQGMSKAEARRLLDFCVGLTVALDGSMQRVTKHVFILAPFNVNLLGGEDENLDTVAKIEIDEPMIVDPYGN